MDEIGIEDLRVRTQVGISPHELGVLQELSITIQMKISVEKAGKTDQVVDTVNYKTITKEVLYHVENKKYNLIETVATDVARICVVRHEVPVVKVTVKKPNSLRFARASTVTIQRRFDDFDWKDVHVSIGSNINPLARAIELLQKKCSIVKLSKAFVTTPVIDEDQADFVNMAVLIRTKLDPEGLKLFMYDIESQLGRQRDPLNKNAPRAIDLDIAFWEDNLLEYKLATNGSTKSWCIPDPDIIKYAHVIVPLADISPAFIHPLEKKPLSVMAEDITGKQDFVSFFPKICLENNRHRTNPKAPISNKCAAPIGISTQCEAGSGRLDEATPRPVALVTGGSKRLGATIARRLHQVGYNVVVHYNLSVVHSSKLVKDLNSLRVNSARAVQADVTTDVQKTAEKIIQESLGIWGRLDVLVNNASIFQSTAIGDVTEDIWKGLIQTNLTAPFFLCQAAYPSLKASRGCIVNIGDVHAVRPLTNHSVYCISKAGLHMSTLALAQEFAPNVRVNGVAPGAILWPEQEVGTDGDLPQRQEILDKIPMGRIGGPHDIASTVEYLVVHGRYVTGQVINVDGGRTLNQ